MQYYLLHAPEHIVAGIVLYKGLNNVRWQFSELISQNKRLQFLKQEAMFLRSAEDRQQLFKQYVFSIDAETIINCNSGN